MKEVLYNYDNLTKEDIDEVVVRTKGLLINSRNEITLGYSHKTYQFPGGHLEPGETLLECLIREIKEETGIDITNMQVKPLERITYYNKNYRNTGKNRQNEIHYFVIKTDKKFDMDNSNLDSREIEGNYTVRIIDLDDVERILIGSIPDNPINEVIVDEMLEVLKEYNKRCKEL